MAARKKTTYKRTTRKKTPQKRRKTQKKGWANWWKCMSSI